MNRFAQKFILMRKLLIIILLCINAFAVLAQERTFSLEDIFYYYAFSERDVYDLRFMNDGEHYSILEDGNILKYNIETGNLTDTILSSNWTNKIHSRILSNANWFCINDRYI